MIDPESESCGWPVGFCKRGRSMIGTSISPWQWSRTLVTWFCSTVIMNELLLSTYHMFRAFITCAICQICKCLCKNNDLLWGTSWRLQAAKLQWKPQLWDLWSGWGAVYCTLFVDGWTILVCWKVFERFLKVFAGCKHQSYKIFEAVEEQFITHFLRTVGQYWFVAQEFKPLNCS